VFTGHLPELFLVLIVALIVFGPSKLPEVGSAVGRGLREFRRATSEIEDAVLHQSEPEEDELFPHQPPAPVMTGDAAEPIPPAVDTLAMRRDARRAAQETPASAEETSGPAS